MQCRSIISRLGLNFRLVFVDGPFLCKPHPDIVPVYGEHGPFRRWLRVDSDHPEIEAQSAMEEIWYMCDRAMEEDRGTADWVGVLGFSQGAKIAASILWTQEKIAERLGPAKAATNFKFGILMAGRGPVVVLDPRLDVSEHVADAGHAGTDFDNWPKTNEGDHVLSIPTLHVHGLQDEGIEHHRRLLAKYCKTGTTRLVEWNGGHRLPIKSWDVEAVAKEILQMAVEAGISIRA